MEGHPRVLVFTGHGKGKTTAAIGLSIRAAGHGMRVCFVQFVKDRELPTGEALFLDKEKNIDLVRAGLGRIFSDDKSTFPSHVKIARWGLNYAIESLQKRDCDLLVLDEACVAIHNKVLGIDDITELIRIASETQVIAVTGRYAGPELIDMADTVTEMKSIKHAFERGQKAQKGVEM